MKPRVYLRPDRATRVTAIWWRWDPQLTGLIKAYVGARSRSWDPGAKVWHVDSLAIPDLLLHIERCGYDVVDTTAAVVA